MTDVVEMKLRDVLDYLQGMFKQVGTTTERVELFYEFMARHKGSCMTLQSGTGVTVSIELFGVKAVGCGKDVRGADALAVSNWLVSAFIEVLRHG